MIRELLNFVELYSVVIFGSWILLFFACYFPDHLKKIGFIDEETYRILKGEKEK